MGEDERGRVYFKQLYVEWSMGEEGRGRTNASLRAGKHKN
jgi:hypothetical protein